MSLNKLGGIVRASAVAMCAAPGRAAPADRCVGDSPTSVTRWVWKHGPGLDGAHAERFVSATLLAAIRRDTERAKANDEICGICGG